MLSGLAAVVAWRPASAGYADDVGYARLAAALGPAVPTGAGVVVSQVEATVDVNGVATWMPDPSNAAFAGKSITSASPGAPAGVYSGHATGVGIELYGAPDALAHDITTVRAYFADSWIGSNFLCTAGIRRPYYSTSRIVNHSWVGDAGSLNSEVLRRLDWVIAYDDMIHVAGLGNGDGTATSPLVGSAFNTIAIGRSEGQTQTGSVAIDPPYSSGRTRPDVVVPAVSTSLATARASGAIALLVQAAHADPSWSTDPAGTSSVNRAYLVIRNAERVEAIRAALMAGANRVTRNTSGTDLVAYGDAAHRSGNGLDTRYGAGQIDVEHSWRILAAGEQNSAEDGGPGAGNATRGFDYDPAFGGLDGSNTTGTYPLPVSARPQLLTATLDWNLQVDGGTQTAFVGAAILWNLDLELIDVADGGAVVQASRSVADNTESLWLEVPANARYALRVTRDPATAFRHDYGVAWQLLPDADGDGAPDESDDCIDAANGPFVPDAGGNVQRDTDGDGYGNVCDADLDNNGTVNLNDYLLFRAAFGSTSENADFNGDGAVTVADFAIFRARFLKPPG